MARFKFQATFQDRLGRVVTPNQVGVATFYLAGTTTLATIYAAESGGSAISGSQVATDADGFFEAWVDDSDYALTQKFKVTLTADGFGSKSRDDLLIFPLTDLLSNTESVTTIVPDSMFNANTSIWTASDASIEYSGGQAKFGAKSMKVIATHASNDGYAEWDIKDFARYKDATITVGVWVYAATGNTGTYQVRWTDSVGSSTLNIVAADSWQWVSLTHIVDASATSLNLRFYATVGAGQSDEIFVDGVSVLEGTTVVAAGNRIVEPLQLLDVVFTETDNNRTSDLVWTDVDITTAVSKTATWVHLAIEVNVDSVTAGAANYAEIGFRRKGSAPIWYSKMRVDGAGFAANSKLFQTFWVPLDNDKIFQYEVDIEGTIQIDILLAVMGWM